MFFDHVTIFVASGKGGDGVVSFRREAFVPQGGPDGGDGGKGGDVVLRVSSRLNSLGYYRFKHHFKAADGEAGRGKKMSGKSGEDLVLEVPPGTLVYDDETDQLIADLTEEEDFVLLPGGKGGLGNVHFKNSRRQAPRFARAGEDGKELTIRLELRLIADVGLLGRPNAGKSSLLAALSRAKPKIADYPFTTIQPQLGVVEQYDQSFVLADIPGLIEGAAEGVGLGHDFLRHVSRCRLLLHVVDVYPLDRELTPRQAYDQIQEELRLYGAGGLAEVPQILVLNKADLLANEVRAELARAFADVKDPKVWTSTVTHEGLDELKQVISQTLEDLPEPEKVEQDRDWHLYRFADDTPFTIRQEADHYEVTGAWISNLVRSTNFDDLESFHYFQRQIEDKALNRALLDAGAQSGDWVNVVGYEFQFYPDEA